MWHSILYFVSRDGLSTFQSAVFWEYDLILSSFSDKFKSSEGLNVLTMIILLIHLSRLLRGGCK